MLEPGAMESIPVDSIDEIVPSKLSMMPEGLLNNFEESEILDLMAYLLSRGDQNHEMFSRK